MYVLTFHLLQLFTADPLLKQAHNRSAGKLCSNVNTSIRGFHRGCNFYTRLESWQLSLNLGV